MRFAIVQFLDRKLVNQLKEEQTVIMDNAKIHKTDKTKKLIENTGCNLVFLPPLQILIQSKTSGEL
jgi:transposase